MFVSSKSSAKPFRPGSAASNANRYNVNKSQTQPINTLLTSSSNSKLNTLAIPTNNNNNIISPQSSPTTQQQQQQLLYNNDDSNNNTSSSNHIPVYVPAPNQLESYYYIAKFMSSSINDIEANDKQIDKLHTTLYKPVRNKHKSYQVIKQEKKLDRQKSRQKKLASGSNKDSTSTTNIDNDVSDDDSNEVIRRWKIQAYFNRLNNSNDNNKNNNRRTTTQQQQQQIPSDYKSYIGTPESYDNTHDYALLVKTTETIINDNNETITQPCYKLIPISRFINFRSDDNTSSNILYNTIEEAEAAMKEQSKYNERWLYRSNTLKRYETEKLLEDGNIHNIDVIDDDRLQQRIQRLKLQQLKSKHEYNDDTLRKNRRERQGDYTEHFSDDEDNNVKDDLIDNHDNDDNDSDIFEDKDDNNDNTKRDKRTVELLNKQNNNEFNNDNNSNKNNNNDKHEDKKQNDNSKDDIKQSDDNDDSDDSYNDDDVDDDEINVSGDELDDDYMDTNDNNNTQQNNNTTTKQRKSSPLEQRPSTPQPPNIATNTATNRKRAQDSNNIDNNKKQRTDTINQQQQALSQSLNNDSILTEQDFRNCFKIQSIHTVQSLAAVLRQKLLNTANRPIMIQFIKTLCNQSGNQFTLKQ